jgi:hypothetical protein
VSTEQVDAHAPVIVRRWRRYGHDRAYVSVSGADLGYRDLLTGIVHCERTEDVERVASATADVLDRATANRLPEYEPRHRKPESAQPAATVRGRGWRPAQAPLLADRDLAANRPGESARQFADAIRDAAPVRNLVARLVGASTEDRSWRLGAEGEVEVARRLARLDDAWRVLHCVPVGERGSDIDHVAIGPAGVFTINAKHHPGAQVWVNGDVVKVNGTAERYVRNSRHEAQRAARLLTAAAGFDVPVCALIVIVGASRGLVIREQPHDGVVTVLGNRQLVRYLGSLPTVLGHSTRRRVYDVARHLSTWRPKTVRKEIFPE